MTLLFLSMMYGEYIYWPSRIQNLGTYLSYTSDQVPMSHGAQEHVRENMTVTLF